MQRPYSAFAKQVLDGVQEPERLGEWKVWSPGLDEENGIKITKSSRGRIRQGTAACHSVAGSNQMIHHPLFSPEQGAHPRHQPDMTESLSK